jgi:hypothetical protein
MLNPIQSQLDRVIAGTQQLTLPIHDEEGTVIGTLRPLTLAYLDDAAILEKLTDWRNQNMTSFLSQFTATLDRTRSWLSNVVFQASGQMLFLVYSNDLLMGHLGFKNLTPLDALMDNAIRGARGGHPKIFVMAHKTLAKWLFQEAKIESLYGYVMIDNAPAIMMNKQVGWSIWIRLPLLKLAPGEDDVRWEIGDEDQASPEGKYCYKIIMARSDMIR